MRVGRSVRNHVVLYSAIVSRCHLELIQDYQGWKVVNLGTNGTYINGQPVHECRVEDGQIIQIALSGPKIQLKIQPEPSFSSRTPNLTTQKNTMKIQTDSQPSTVVERVKAANAPPDNRSGQTEATSEPSEPSDESTQFDLTNPD